MSVVKFIKRNRFVHLCFAITFFISGVLINSVQFVLYYSLRPINKWLYRKINFYLCYSLYSYLVFLGDWWSNSQLFLYIDKDDFEKYYGKEHAFLVMNHSYEVDWLMGWMFCERIQCLGNCKAYAKESIKYLPTLGMAWKFSEFVFLKRSYDQDKEIIPQQIKELVDHPDPIWLLLFPEGTRFTPEKHLVSQKFAKEHGLPILKHHLTPRTKGFVASLPPMYEKMPAIYDIILTFKYNDNCYKPTITNMLNGIPVEGHMYIRRIPFDQVPRDPEEASRFLRDMFERKDKMVDSFIRTGDFFTDSNVKRVEMFQLPRRKYPMIHVFTWSAIILTPICYSLASLFNNGQYFYLFTVMSMFSSCNFVYYFLNKSIGMSEISKSSSYGSEKSKQN